MKRHAPYLSRVLELVRERGPLPAETVPEPDGTKGRRRGEFWAWTRAKAALEAHFARGTLAIAGRRRAGFARMYDLAARVLPPQHHRRDVARHEAQRDLLRQSARALGVGTEADLADYFRMPIREARPRIAELEEAGELHPARVEGWRERALLFRGAVVAPRVAACALLSPFDPVVWHRPRTQRLFGFDYRLEIWVPRARRRWGYYVLPFLLDDRLVARVDLKADRAGGRLLVPSAYVEPGVDERRTADALAAELGAMAGWLGLESVAVERRNAFSRRLAAAVRRRGR